jgi:hypothetical protein
MQKHIYIFMYTVHYLGQISSNFECVNKFYKNSPILFVANMTKRINCCTYITCFSDLIVICILSSWEVDLRDLCILSVYGSYMYPLEQTFHTNVINSHTEVALSNKILTYLKNLVNTYLKIGRYAHKIYIFQFW